MSARELVRVAPPGVEGPWRAYGRRRLGEADTSESLEWRSEGYGFLVRKEGAWRFASSAGPRAFDSSKPGAWDRARARVREVLFESPRLTAWIGDADGRLEFFQLRSVDPEEEPEKLPDAVGKLLPFRALEKRRKVA